MAMRNFWLEAHAEGRSSAITGGPRANDGTMTIRLYQKEEGQNTTALRVECYPNTDGTLHTKVYAGETLVHEVTTKA